MSRIDAETNWAKWAKEDSGVDRLHTGPPHAPLMLWVQKGMYKDNIARTELAKSVIHSGGAVKKADAEQIARMQERALSGHDKVGGVDVCEISGIAAGVFANIDASCANGGHIDVSGALGGEGLTSVSIRQHVMQPDVAAGLAKAEQQQQDAQEDLGQIPTPRLQWFLAQCRESVVSFGE